MTAPLVVLTPEQLAELVESAVERALARHQGAVSQPSALPTHLTMAEAAGVLRCSTRWVRQLVSDGRLPAARVGTSRRSHVRISRTAVERLLADSTH